MHVRITSHRDPEPLDLEAFERLAEFVLEREDVPEQAELSLAVVEVDEMTELNDGYREPRRARPTCSRSDATIRVRSTATSRSRWAMSSSRPRSREAQAEELGHTIEEELNLLLVHGILHLLGYEHDTDEDAAVMRARERALLAAYADSRVDRRRDDVRAARSCGASTTRSRASSTRCAPSATCACTRWRPPSCWQPRSCWESAGSR